MDTVSCRNIQHRAVANRKHLSFRLLYAAFASNFAGSYTRLFGTLYVKPRSY